MKLVITMSRRFGTGASIIANELSVRLGIPVYDKASIEHKLDEHEYESEAEAIRRLAESPCIILGRCASNILKDRMNVLNIYVCADKEGPDPAYHETGIPLIRGGKGKAGAHR